jgi:hypothetical protein
MVASSMGLERPDGRAGPVDGGAGFVAEDPVEVE